MSGPLQKGKLPKELTGEMEATAKASQYLRQAVRKLRDFLPIEKKRRIWKTLEKIFETEPITKSDYMMYNRGGYKQSPQKTTFQDESIEIALKRKIPSYHHSLMEPMGQRELRPFTISQTDVSVEPEALHYLNNFAMQQLYDDIKRTLILNLDIPHRTIQVRADKEVTPETVNQYLRSVQHTIGGGTILLEQFADVDPSLVSDAYCKVITGNDEIKDFVDPRLLIDIDKQFHESKVKKIKEAIGDTIHLVIRAPTLVVRTGDAGATLKWGAMNSVIAFIGTYRLAFDSVISDIAHATRQANTILIGEKTWSSRAHSPNELGGIPFGYLADICQGDSELPAKPFLRIVKEDEELARKYLSKTIGCMSVIVPVLTEIWTGLYTSGNFNLTSALLAASFCADIQEDFLDILANLTHKYFSRIIKYDRDVTPSRWYNLRWVIETIIHEAMTTLEKYPTAMELLWSGIQRTFLLGSIAANIASLLTGSPTAGLWGLRYANSLLVKEGWLRSAAGSEMVDHIGMPNSCSLRLEEGGLPELQGLNTPLNIYGIAQAYAMAGAGFCAALARGDPWVCSPIVKVAFADPSLKFNFKDPLKDIIAGAQKSYTPAGERIQKKEE
ncbi:MAG: coenzyme-B sulfoethylthiotransferase subunit alpha [Candidatus Helarchaeota archaeon]|nr:coenzyme-B sulfoethylthiotransferase subunit alpha [Candidatus Helarchaeota archaeon]